MAGRLVLAYSPLTGPLAPLTDPAAVAAAVRDLLRRP